MSYIRKFIDSSRELGKVQTIAVCAMMLALRIVLGMFANISLSFIPLPVIKISFAFIPVVLTAFLYGPVCAGIVACFGDIFSYLLAPTALGFNPAITACYLIEGLIYGLCLYKTELKLPQVIAAKVLVLVLCTVTLNGIVLHALFFSSYPLHTVILYRAAVLVPMGILEVALMMMLRKPLLRIKKDLLKQ